jgi:hypothetical protein
VSGSISEHSASAWTPEQHPAGARGSLLVAPHPHVFSLSHQNFSSSHISSYRCVQIVSSTRAKRLPFLKATAVTTAGRHFAVLSTGRRIRSS